MRTVVKIENLSKRYRLGEITHRTLYEEVRSFIARKTGRAASAAFLNQDGTARTASQRKELWALRNVSFDIRDGDVVGIIGRNGAGKSTLLKILSRITAPTAGRAEIHGRLASLLEVGTGFHPELTGRENVYLNGAVLGMKKSEIAARFDEIVDFSGVEEFLDTPVKRYSSGMRVRLAFAVAAHIDPDILIIDEVLAVGDAAFQHKCLGKIGTAAREGRTVLFVSHNAAAVENLCRRGIVLKDGQVAFDGTQTEALDFYGESLNAANQSLAERKDRRGNGGIKITNLEWRNSEGRPAGTLPSGKDVELWAHFEQQDSKRYEKLNFEFKISTQFETPVFSQGTQISGLDLPSLPRKGVFVCRIPRLPLPPGSYRLSYRLRANMNYLALDSLTNALELHVEGGDFFGSGEMPPIQSGVVLVDADWQVM